MDILTEIVDHTRCVVAERVARTPLPVLEKHIAAQTFSGSGLVARLSEHRPHIIAEFKRKSPSKPAINLDADPVTVARAYARGGASAMSILTEPDYFAGSPDDLRAVRPVVDLPLLRKDFMIDPYQFFEARAMGANLVLLIARILDRRQLAVFTELAHELGLEVLVEIHHPDELAIVGDAPIDLLGVNCRDLKHFSTDIEVLIRCAPSLPAHIPWVAESGIHSPADLKRLYQAGYRLFLIGEYLMKSPDPAQRLRELIDP